MKLLLSVLTLVSLSSAAFAEVDCKKTALKLAKVNLDSKAKAHGFNESSIDASSLKVLGLNETKAYSVKGNIHRANYEVLVDLDSYCGVEAVRIKDVL